MNKLHPHHVSTSKAPRRLLPIPSYCFLYSDLWRSASPPLKEAPALASVTHVVRQWHARRERGTRDPVGPSFVDRWTVGRGRAGRRGGGCADSAGPAAAGEAPAPGGNDPGDTGGPGSDLLALAGGLTAPFTGASIGDMDGNGRPVVAGGVANPDAAEVRILAIAPITHEVSLLATAAVGRAVAVYPRLVDLDGDGADELLVATDDGAGQGRLILFGSDPESGPAATIRASAFTGPRQVATADFDGEPGTDIAWLDGPTLVVARSNGGTLNLRNVAALDRIALGGAASCVIPGAPHSAGTELLCAGIEAAGTAPDVRAYGYDGVSGRFVLREGLRSGGSQVTIAQGTVLPDGGRAVAIAMHDAANGLQVVAADPDWETWSRADDVAFHDVVAAPSVSGSPRPWQRAPQETSGSSSRQRAPCGRCGRRRPAAPPRSKSETSTGTAARISWCAIPSMGSSSMPSIPT